MWLLCPKGLSVWCRGMGTLKLVLNQAAPEQPGRLSPAQCHPSVAAPLPCPKLALHHTTHNGDMDVAQHPLGWDGALPSSTILGGRAIPIACALEDTAVTRAAHSGGGEGKKKRFMGPCE